MHAWISKAKGSGALARLGSGRILEPLEEGVGQRFGFRELLHLQETHVDVVADGAQLRQGVQALVGLEVLGVVDRRFGAQRLGFFEVLLDMAALVGDVQAWNDAGGDNARAVAGRWWWSAPRAMDREEQTDLIRPAQ